MMKTYKQGVLFATVALLFLHGGVAKYTAQLDAQYKQGNKRGIFRPGVVVPVWQKDDAKLAYLTAIGMFDTHNAKEGNLGFGYRQIVNNAIIGGYGFYDYRRTKHYNNAHQITFGLEYMTTKMELRTNVYIPVSKTTFSVGNVSIQDTIGFEGPNTFVDLRSTRPVERVHAGFDAEAGYKMPNLPINAYAGGYYFSGHGVSIAGPRFRVEAKPWPWLILSGEYQWDKHRKSVFYGGAGFRLSFEKNPSPFSLHGKMTQMPVRDVDVVDIDTNEDLGTVRIIGKEVDTAKELMECLRTDRRVALFITGNIDFTEFRDPLILRELALALNDIKEFYTLTATQIPEQFDNIVPTIESGGTINDAGLGAGEVSALFSLVGGSSSPLGIILGNGLPGGDVIPVGNKDVPVKGFITGANIVRNSSGDITSVSRTERDITGFRLLPTRFPNQALPSVSGTTFIQVPNYAKSTLSINNTEAFIPSDLPAFIPYALLQFTKDLVVSDVHVRDWGISRNFTDVGASFPLGFNSVLYNAPIRHGAAGLIGYGDGGKVCRSRNSQRLGIAAIAVEEQLAVLEPSIQAIEENPALGGQFGLVGYAKNMEILDNTNNGFLGFGGFDRAFSMSSQALFEDVYIPRVNIGSVGIVGFADGSDILRNTNNADAISSSGITIFARNSRINGNTNRGNLAFSSTGIFTVLQGGQANNNTNHGSVITIQQSPFSIDARPSIGIGALAFNETSVTGNKNFGSVDPLSVPTVYEVIK